MMTRLLFTILLLCSSVYAHHVTNNKRIMIAYAEEWPPYSYRDENGDMQGILIDLANKLLHNMLHVDIEHAGFPWKRAQILAEEGTYDAIITYPSKSRQVKYLYSKENMIDLEWRGFSSINSKYHDIAMKAEDPLMVKHTRLTYCSVLGDETTLSLLNKAGIDSHKSKNVDFAIKALNEGRTDFFVNSKFTTLNIIYKNGAQDSIKMHPKVYKKVPFHFLLSKNSDIPHKVIKALDELIVKMKKDGSYSKLIEEVENKAFHKWNKQ